MIKNTIQIVTNLITKISFVLLIKFFYFRCHSYDYGDTGEMVCRLSHHSRATLSDIQVNIEIY